MDLALLIQKDQADCELVDTVTGESIGAVITVCSTESQQYKDALSNARENPDTDQFLADLTVNWKGIVFNGADVEFSTDNAKMIYKSVPAVKQQINLFIGEVRNFLPVR